jgi:hypothetical protein
MAAQVGVAMRGGSAVTRDVAASRVVASAGSAPVSVSVSVSTVATSLGAYRSKGEYGATSEISTTGVTRLMP